MKLGDIYLEGGIGFFLLYGFIFLVITIGSVGQAIWLYIWWGRIKINYANRRDENSIAFDLYVSVVSGWIFGALFWILTVVSGLMAYLASKFCKKPGKTTEFFKNSSILCSIGFTVTCVLVLVWSSNKNCNKIYEVGFHYTNATKEFQDWKIKTNITDDELPDYQCYEGDVYTWVFFGFYLFGLILLVVSIPCVKVTLQVDVSQILLPN